MAENAGLTEWPVPLLGRFDPAFLERAARGDPAHHAHQPEIFRLPGEGGALAPNFVCVANIDASDGGAAIVEGNRKVLAARLSDAKFFWEQDLKVPLDEQAKKLDQIVFHEKLGTVADKAERVAKLAEWLVERADHQGRRPRRCPNAAARLAKADLVTEMVGEFPELQGMMGGYYARAQGQPDAVADAIRDHYKPAGQGDEVPTDKVTVAVNIADRLDTLVAFFSIGEKPTGSRDPFALRRAALGFLQILTRSGLRIPLSDVLTQAAVLVVVSRLGALSSITFPDLLDSDDHEHEITAEVGSFTYRHGEHVVVRWKAELTPNIERGKIIEEVKDIGEADPRFPRGPPQGPAARGRGPPRPDRRRVRLGRRGRSRPPARPGEGAAGLRRAGGGRRPPRRLQARRQHPQEGGMDWGRRREEAALLLPQIEESELDDALDAAEPKVKAAIEAEEYERAMAALASLRGPVDAFFDKVTVNDPDPAKREVRLNLLARVRDAVHRVADFSRIEG